MATMREYLKNSCDNRDKHQIPQNHATPNIPYMLFVYREELRRINKHAVKLSKSKLNLTQELISYSVNRITEYDKDELMNINRGISFSLKLKSSLDDMKQMQKVRNMQQIQFVEKN